MKCSPFKQSIITYYIAGAEKFKISMMITDLHPFMEDGCEICADEDVIEEIINDQLLILVEIFEQASDKKDHNIKDSACTNILIAYGNTI